MDNRVQYSSEAVHAQVQFQTHTMRPEHFAPKPNSQLSLCHRAMGLHALDNVCKTDAVLKYEIQFLSAPTAVGAEKANL